MKRFAPFPTHALLVVAACSSTSPSTGKESEFSPFDRAMEEALAHQGLAGATAVIVRRDSGIVHLEGYGSFGKDRIFLIASASKPLSVGVLMRLADQRLLDLDAPIRTYVGDAWGDAKGALTLARLVSNSSGMVGLLDNPFYQPYGCQYRPAGTLAGCAEAIYRADDAARTIAPDTRFRYGGGQWQLAGGIAEAVSGKPWAQLVRETYLDPCGTTSLGYTNPFTQGLRGYPDSFQGNPAGLPATENPNIEGGGYVTAEDYGKILLMHLRGGVCGGTRVLSEAAVARMQQDRIGATYGGATGIPAFEGYGLGWWVDRAHPGVVASPGFYGAMPWLDTQRGYGVVILLEADGRARDALWARVGPVLDSILGAAR